jgi:hypothetical protein
VRDIGQLEHVIGEEIKTGETYQQLRGSELFNWLDWFDWLHRNGAITLSRVVVV